MMRSATAKAWSKGVGNRGPINIVATDQGVTTTFDSGETTFTWEVFPRSREWSDYYFLMRNRLIVATIIPRRAFTSVTDEAKFRSLLRVHTTARLISNKALDLS